MGFGDILAGALKGTVTAAKWAGNAALDAVAAQGGPNCHYKLQLSEQLSCREDLNARVEEWIFRWMKGVIGSRDPYFKRIRENLERYGVNFRDGRPCDFVRSCMDSNVVLYPMTSEVQKFSLRAVLVTGDVVNFDVSCWESAHIDQSVLRGF